jgi:hypothetical protein
MMSRLNVASWGLLLGATGQVGLCDALLRTIPLWMLFAALLPPWLTVYTISFCRQAPFGFRPFRHCLIFAICWYSVATTLAEALHFLVQPSPHGHFPTSVARVLTYAGGLSFIVFVRACVLLRRDELSAP